MLTARQMMLREWYIFRSGHYWSTMRQRIRALLALPAWGHFKVLNSKLDAPLPPPEAGLAAQVDKEKSLETICAVPDVKTFLEIGVGHGPNIDRLSMMRAHGVSYTGCDFEHVCRSHERELQHHKYDCSGVTFVSNSEGSYVWTLFQLMKSNRPYDAIYLDGHHTMYIDLPAALLADQLLRPGGFLVLDDIRWTLGFLKGSMKTYFREWEFYRKAYNFDEYSKEQQNMAHIGMIARQVIIPRLGYKRRDDLSSTDWWVLQKPG